MIFSYKKIYRIGFIVFLSMIIFSCGCYRSTKVPMNFVEGVVTLDGSPVTGASILFVPKESSSGIGAAGLSDANGKYHLTSATGDSGKGTLAGEYLVTVSKYEFVDLSKPKIDPDSQSETLTQSSKNVLPENYRFQKTTPISVTVKEGKNLIDLPLKK